MTITITYTSFDDIIVQRVIDVKDMREFRRTNLYDNIDLNNLKSMVAKDQNNNIVQQYYQHKISLY